MNRQPTKVDSNRLGQFLALIQTEASGLQFNCRLSLNVAFFHRNATKDKSHMFTARVKRPQVDAQRTGQSDSPSAWAHNFAAVERRVGQLVGTL